MKNTILLLFALLPFAAISQVRLSGTVTDNKGTSPLPGAHIVIENTFLTDVADASGHFVFKSLKKGACSLKVSHVGFQTVKIDLVLQTDTSISVMLEEEPILGEEVNITATRAGEKYPVASTLMSQKEISKVNLGKDLPYIIQNMPSVVTTSDAGTGIGYTGLTIRGTDLTRINVTMNGIPLNDAESQGVWFVDLPDIASSTADIQVQRGVGTSTNGAGAFGATVNIQTEGHREDPYGEVTFAGGSYGTARGSASFGSGTFGRHFAVDGRVSVLSSDGYIDRASADLRSYYIAGGYYGKNTTLKLLTFSGTEKTYQAWEGVPGDSLESNRTFNPAGLYYDSAGNIRYYRNQTDNYRQDHYQMIFSQNLAPHWNLNAALFYTKGYGYYESYKMQESFADYGRQNVILGGDTISQTDLVNRKYLDNDFYGITFSSNYSLKEKLKLTVGGGWNRYYGEHYGTVIWAQYASNGNSERNWYYSTGDKSDFNIYMKAVYTLFGKLNLFADLQYRYVHYAMKGTLDDLRSLDQVHTFNFFNPKAGIWYDFSDRHHAWLSFGIANREPSRNNYQDADPGKIPAFETLHDYEAGYSFHNRWLRAVLNLYYMHYRDQLVLTGEINSVGEAVMVNVPQSYRAGIEVTAGITILKSLTWDVNVAISRNKILDFTSYTDNYDISWNYLGQVTSFLGTTNLSFSPPVNIGSTIRYMPLKGLTFSFYSKYIGRQYIDNTSTTSRSLDPWFVNNLGAEYALEPGFFKEVVFQVMVGNIFSARYISNGWVYPYILDGEEYEMTGWFPQSPVTFMAGITLRL
jgi:iron complex outermembrane recepter protein